MSHIITRADGRFECLNRWLIVHKDGELLSKGKAGQVTTPWDMEDFDTELEMEDRIVSLGLDVSNFEELGT